MQNILVVSGHTDLNNSVANKAILERLENKLPQAEFVYLDKLYSDFQIDVEAEQEKLLNADIIVLQFPIFWYAMPSLLSRWLEETFQHGFSHGSTGDKLKGKKLIASFTTGAPEFMYSYEGAQKYPIEDFLPPIKAMCNLCGLDYFGYVYTGGVSYQNRNDTEKMAEMKEKAVMHADKLLELLKGIRPDVDFETETALIDDGILDSFDVVSIISELDDEFGVQIRIAELDPDNFNSLQSIWSLVQKLKSN